jgi:hypothetical protein
MRLVLFVAGPLAIEEALFARSFLEQLPADVEALVVCHTAIVYYLIEDITSPESCRWLMARYDGDDDRPRIDQVIHDFAPDLILLADPAAVDGPSGRLPSEWLESLDRPVVAMDTGSERPDLPVPWLQACPPGRPSGEDAYWQPFGGLEGPLARYQMRDELLGRHRLPPETPIVMLPFSLQTQLAANVRLLGAWYQTMIQVVAEHLGQLDKPCLFVIVTPGCAVGPERRGDLVIAPYNELTPSLMGRFLAAADVLLVEQLWRYWRFRALAQGTPTLLLSNSLVMDQGGQPQHAFATLTPAMRGYLQALQAQAGHALFRWLNFPQPTAEWPTVSYDPQQAWARLDLFDSAGSIELLQRVLSPEEREAWRTVGERFLAAGRGAGDLKAALKRLQQV